MWVTLDLVSRKKEERGEEEKEGEAEEEMDRGCVDLSVNIWALAAEMD